jgi:hypothetical protein
MRRDDAIDPLEQAQTLQILVGAGIKTREEARRPGAGADGGRRVRQGARRGRQRDDGVGQGAADGAAKVQSASRRTRAVRDGGRSGRRRGQPGAQAAAHGRPGRCVCRCSSSCERKPPRFRA